jgi:hypothetical protein
MFVFSGDVLGVGSMVGLLVVASMSLGGGWLVVGGVGLVVGVVAIVGWVAVPSTSVLGRSEGSAGVSMFVVVGTLSISVVGES